MSNRKTLNEKIETARAEVEEKEKRLKELLQTQKAEERKARTHRLCERGGKVEKLLPDLIRLNEAQFETFVQKTLLSGYAAKIIRELLPPEDNNGQNGTGQNGSSITSKAVNVTDGGNILPKSANAADSGNASAKPAGEKDNGSTAPKPAGGTGNIDANGNIKPAQAEKAAS